MPFDAGRELGKGARVLDYNQYWKRLVSNGLRFLQGQGNADAVAVIKNAELDFDIVDHDNWDGGIDYWELRFRLKYKDFTALGDKKVKIENDILTALNRYHTDEKDRLVNVLIQPIIEQYIDWNSVLPVTKEETIQLIREEQKMLVDVATCDLSFKEDGVAETYQKQHQKILAIASTAGFDYPVNANSLVEWWGVVKEMPHYSDRREYISKMYTPLLNMLRESEEDIGSDVISDIITTQKQIQSLSQQAYERFESAKRIFYDVGKNERARKDAVRSCVDAMEALIKELGAADEIGEATKHLKDAKDSNGENLWGPVELVKDGNNLFNLLHRLYPDVRHGTQDIATADMPMEEAEYFVGRITTFMKFIAARARKMGRL